MFVFEVSHASDTGRCGNEGGRWGNDRKNLIYFSYAAEMKCHISRYAAIGPAPASRQMKAEWSKIHRRKSSAGGSVIHFCRGRYTVRWNGSSALSLLVSSMRGWGGLQRVFDTAW